MAVARDGNGAVHQRADERPNEPRHRLRPTTHQLQTERHAVDVGAIVRDDAEGQNHEAELPEAAEGREQHGREESADAGLFVAVGVAFVDGVEGRGCDGQAEHFGEAEGRDETAPCPKEGFHS